MEEVFESRFILGQQPPTMGAEIDDKSPGVDSGLFSDVNVDRPRVVRKPDVNIYQQKKTLAQGMMDLALLSANANQLRYVLESPYPHPYYLPFLVLIGISISLQIGVGCMLIWNSVYNVKELRDMCRANRINNFTVLGIFIITVVNVFASVFAVPSNVPADRKIVNP